MIQPAELMRVGKIIKPHGINGEMSIAFSSWSVMDALTVGDCVFMEIDGIFTPFFVKSLCTRSSESLLVSFDCIDSQPEVLPYIGLDLWAKIDDVPPEESDDEDGLYASQLVGYKAFDTQNNFLGEIVDIDDSTENALFVIDKTNTDKQLLVPIADELIEEISTQKHTIILDLPLGLIEL